MMERADRAGLLCLCFKRIDAVEIGKSNNIIARTKDQFKPNIPKYQL